MTRDATPRGPRAGPGRAPDVTRAETYSRALAKTQNRTPDTPPDGAPAAAENGPAARAPVVHLVEQFAVPSRLFQAGTSHSEVRGSSG
ncbi:MAG: hypothetical protein QOH19_981 [Actinomycetota bacterium]|nr:hypothetical protein [Actinomycetota bacterium]